MQALRLRNTGYLVWGHVASGWWPGLHLILSLLFPTHHALPLGINLSTSATSLLISLWCVLRWCFLFWVVTFKTFKLGLDHLRNINIIEFQFGMRLTAVLTSDQKSSGRYPAEFPVKCIDTYLPLFEKFALHHFAFMTDLHSRLLSLRNLKRIFTST